MAKGSFYIKRNTGSEYLSYLVEWRSEAIVSQNCSKVYVTVSVIKDKASTEATYGTVNNILIDVGDYRRGGIKKSFSVSPGGKTVLWQDVDFVIDHDDNGKKDVYISVIITGDVIGASGSNLVFLDTILRYAKITTFKVDKRDETSLKVTWGCDVACDKIYYSLNGGSFVETSGYPSFNITGLKVNTGYNVKIRVRRKDSQLTTDSSQIWQATYNYPHCNSSHDFTIGDKLKLKFYNPLGRTFKISLVLADGSVKGEDTISGTSIEGYTNSSWQTYLYSSIPNAPSGKFKVRVVYGNSTITYDNGNIYKVRGNEVPTINGISYKDINGDVVKITGNDQHIVQNQSTVQITYQAATLNRYAGSIKKYSFEVNGVVFESTSAGGTVKIGKLSNESDVTVNLTVTDSRGLSATKPFTIKVLEHQPPTALVTLERLNNYEDESYLTVDGSISSFDGKNSMTIQYRYKLSTDEYSPFVTIPNNETQTLSLDKNSVFVFNVVITDAFDTVFNQEYILYKGVFPLFIDTEKNAVGINEFPAEDEALRVAGGIAHFENGIKIGSFAEFYDATKRTIFDAIYPVNSIYISYSHTNPADLFGGTWKRIKNKFLWAIDETGYIGIMSGEKEHTLTVDELPSHSHGSVYSQHANGTKDKAWYNTSGTSVAYGAVAAGGGKAHNNMPPYIQVSIWRRTA